MAFALLDLNIIFSSSLNLPTNFSISFLYSYTVFHCVYVPTLKHCHSSAEGPLGYSHFLAIVNRAAMTTAEQISEESAVCSFTHMPQCSKTGSHVDLLLDF